MSDERAPVLQANEVSVWDIALRAASIQTKQMRIRWPVKPAFHTGERKHPAWCSLKNRVYHTADEAIRYRRRDSKYFKEAKSSGS